MLCCIDVLMSVSDLMQVIYKVYQYPQEGNQTKQLHLSGSQGAGSLSDQHFSWFQLVIKVAQNVGCCRG